MVIGNAYLDMQILYVIKMKKKTLREMQTLPAGCSKTEPKISPRRRLPSRGRRTAKI